MPSITHVTTAVETLLHETMDVPRAARQRLVFFVLGVLVAGTIVLRRVAITQTHIGMRTVQAASHERRLRRILNDPQVEQAVPMYGRLVRRVLQRMLAGQRDWLIRDERGHSDVVRVLLAALWYRGRAIPLAWVLWHAQHPHAESSWTDCQTLLTQVAAILPDGVRVTVLADRAFGCPAFTNLDLIQGWARFLEPKHLAVAQPDGTTLEITADNIVVATGRRQDVRGAACFGRLTNPNAGFAGGSVVLFCLFPHMFALCANICGKKDGIFHPAGGETRSASGDTPDVPTHRVTRVI
jgi:hypothetical protein